MAEPRDVPVPEYSDLILGRVVLMGILLWLVVLVQIGLVGYFWINQAENDIAAPDTSANLNVMWFVLPAFLAFALGVTWYGRYRMRWLDYVQTRGRTTRGTIESLGASIDKGGSLPVTRFSYEVDGRSYGGKQYYDISERTYERGQSVTVHYDDRNPKRALLM